MTGLFDTVNFIGNWHTYKVLRALEKNIHVKSIIIFSLSVEEILRWQKHFLFNYFTNAPNWKLGNSQMWYIPELLWFPNIGKIMEGFDFFILRFRRWLPTYFTFSPTDCLLLSRYNKQIENGQKYVICICLKPSQAI